MSKKLSRQSIALTLVLMMIFTLFVSVRPKAEETSDSVVETASETDASETVHTDAATEAETTDDIVTDTTEDDSCDDGDVISSGNLDLVGAPSDGALVIGMVGWDVDRNAPAIPTNTEDFIDEVPAPIEYNEDAESYWVVIGIYNATENKVIPISTSEIGSFRVTDENDNDVVGFISADSCQDENGVEQEVFSLKCDQKGNFTIHYNALELSIRVSEDNGNDDEEVRDGLVIGEVLWDDEIEKLRFAENNLRDSDGVSIKSDEFRSIGIKSGDDITPIPLNDINKLSITDEEGNPVSGARIEVAKDGYWDEELDELVEFDIGNGVFSLYFESTGTYVITYDAGGVTGDDEDKYKVYIDAGIPGVAAYSSETVSEDALIGREVEYTSDTRTFYINKYDEVSEDESWGTTRTIKGYRFDNEELEEYLEAYVSVKDTDNGYKVNLADNVIMEFSIIVEFYNKGYWYVGDERYEDDVWEDEAEIHFYYSGDDIEYGLYLDGAPQLGFSGCYQSEDLFKYGVWNDAIDGKPYYVHADTIQGVIDKLSEAAIGEAVPGYVMNADGELVLAANVNVINTGYISVQPSQGGNLELTPQYVASSGNLNGIAFSDSSNNYYVVADANYAAVTGHSGTDADYVELEAIDPALFVDWEQGKLTDAQTAIFEEIANAGDGFVDWKGKLYRVKRNENSYTTRDGIKVDEYYFTFAGTESFMDTPEEALEDYLEELENHLQIINSGVDESVDGFRRRELMPGLHVNLYCDMQFQGDMGELVIGYPDKSLTGGEYHSAVIEASGVEITGPDSYSTATEVNSDSKFNWTASYDFRTYAIDSELDMNGTATGVSAVVPEPNALAEMSYAQKDAIEKGAKLTVDVTANEIDTDGTLDTATQTAVDSIVTATGRDASTIEFLDFTVDASVEGVAGKTNITETKVPMFITVTPKVKFNKNTRYRIARYHNGRVDYIDLVDSLYRDVAGLNIGFVVNRDGTITFLADRFSVYALVDTEAEAVTDKTPVTPTPTQVTPTPTTPAQVTTNENNGVKTGDNTPFAVMLVLMFVSGVSIFAMNARKIKKKK